MKTNQPKYSIGDRVYLADATNSQHWIDCPDCLGKKTWEAKTPAGETVPIACPTCTYGYDVKGVIPEYKVDGKTTALTIGSVRTEQVGDDMEIDYMCTETGIGSGSVYKEERLFQTCEKAEAALPNLVKDMKAYLVKNLMERFANKKTGSAKSVGCMTAYYRKEIRDGKKQVKSGEEGMARIAQNGGGI